METMIEPKLYISGQPWAYTVILGGMPLNAPRPLGDAVEIYRRARDQRSYWSSGSRVWRDPVDPPHWNGEMFGTLPSV